MDHIAQDDVLDLRGVNICLAKRRTDRDFGEPGRWNVPEALAKIADSGALSAEDKDVRHSGSSFTRVRFKLISMAWPSKESPVVYAGVIRVSV
jgi:hypothetical protein